MSYWEKYFPSVWLQSAWCSATVLPEESGTGCSAQVCEWDVCPTDSEPWRERREFSESEAKYEIVNCPLFHPTIGMEMAHVSQGG